MLELATINHEIYKPIFDENNDIYVDKCPYRPYQRKCIEYECRCKAGSSFFNNASFKQHIKSQTHKYFIENYSKYYKEVDESFETINKLKIENEIQKRKLQNCDTKIEKLEKQLKEIKNFINDNEDDNEFKDCIGE